jgi:hypothetical protein
MELGVEILITGQPHPNYPVLDENLETSCVLGRFRGVRDTLALHAHGNIWKLLLPGLALMGLLVETWGYG